MTDLHHLDSGAGPVPLEQPRKFDPETIVSTATDAAAVASAPLTTEQLVARVVHEANETPTSSPSSRRPRILLGLSGSVATIKLPLLAAELSAFADVIVVATEASHHFFTEETDVPVSCRPVLTDASEWRRWKKVGDPVVHIELRRWADAYVIAPLSANTLAKVANGLCDNLLTCVVRAWDFSKPLLVAPAMNTFMWDSPFTEQHLAACSRLGVRVVPPVAKKLACGDIGAGAMAAPADIVAATRELLAAAGFIV